MADRLKSICSGCAEILFLQGGVYGALLVAIMCLHPRLALAGLLAVAAAYASAHLIGMERAFLQAGHYTFNPLFVGMSLGYRLELTLPTLLFVVAAGVLALALTILLAHLLVTRCRLPVLSLPFAVTSVLAYLTVAKYGGVLPDVPAGSPWYPDLELPLWLASFFKSLGGVLFAPSVVVGLLFSLLILRYSRILFGLAVAGYYVGVWVRALLLGSMEQAMQSGNNFNFPLIAMALGGVFLVPSLQSCLLGMLAVAVSPLVLEPATTFLGMYGIPPFTLPFCLVTLGAVCALRAADYPLLSSGCGGSPEEVRENWFVNRLRYPGSPRSLCLPFSGRWTVWQGFNGRWTHRGIWRHAYDFVITDEHGQTHRGDGSRLEDYYCYRLPVLSPVSGRVVRVIETLPDNPVGTVRGGNNWGNLVVLHDARGFFVELSHFAPQSIRVKEGHWVEPGAILGLCGNSGFSPQPHIHLQVQETDGQQAATLPFSFASYSEGDHYHANSLPAEGAQVEPLFADRRLCDVASFVLDDLHEYEVRRDGRPVDRFALHVKIAVDGTRYFDTGRGRLYFGQHDGTFYAYRVEGDDPHLRLLFLALPRLPLAYKQRLAWSDYVPLRVATSGWKRTAAGLAAFLCPKLSGVCVRQQFVGPTTVASEAGSRILGLHFTARVELDETRGLASVVSGDVEFRKLGTRNCDVRRPEAAALSSSAGNEKMTRYGLVGLAGVLLAAAAGVLATASKGESPTRPAVQRSVELERASEYAKAIATLQEQLTTHPRHYTTHLRLGWLCYLSGDGPQAVKYYDQAIQLAPQATEPKLGRLLPLLADARYAEAQATAEQILQTDPGNYFGNLRLAFALRMQGQFTAAERIVQRMLAAYPADVSFLLESGLLDVAQHRSAAAQETFAEVLSLDPTNAVARQQAAKP